MRFDGLDYLEPSIREAARYLRKTNRAAWDREVALMIAVPAIGCCCARPLPYLVAREIGVIRSSLVSEDCPQVAGSGDSA